MIRVRDYLLDQRVFRATSAPATPAVSVILPTYSRCKTGQLESAVSSVLRQTFADLELIVVDDGSRDGSFDLIQKLQAADPRIVHVRHERNSGLHILRVNEGIEIARGRYIAFQFDDDHWRPRALEALVDAIRAATSPRVAVGKAEFTSRAGPGSFVLPRAEPTFAMLHEENCIANNALLIPRPLFDRYGMYDCHIGMRRLCDWDLWLRLMRYVEFVTVDEIVSDISIANPGAIGVTVPWDLALFRYFSDVPRDDLLTPRTWRDYEVDARRIGDVEIAPEIWRRLYEEQIVPFYSRCRHLFPAVEGFPSYASPERKEVLYFCSGYGPTNDVAFKPYDAPLERRGTYTAHFQYGTQLSPRWLDESDIALLVRPHQDHERVAMEQGLRAGRPMGVYLDDDFLSLHEFGPPFDFMAPGTPNRQNLVQMLERADAVWVASRVIAESVRSLNPRVLLHLPAVSESDLPAESPRRREDRPVRIGYAGGSYRLEEFGVLWEALVRLSSEYGGRLEFEFWGVDVSSLPPLQSPVRQVPYETSYFRFLRHLREAGFDILVTPLLDRPRARLAKAPSKYFQVAVAGALGIFSRVLPYDSLPEGLTCLKAENTVTDWYRVLREAVEMPAERFDLMRRRTLSHVRAEFTETVEIHLHEAAFSATAFHAKTRSVRGVDGRPRVVYVAGMVDAEVALRLERWARLLREYGVESVVILRGEVATTPTGRKVVERLSGEGIECELAAFGALDEGLRSVGSEGEDDRRRLRELFERLTPALVHTIGLIPVVGELCGEMGLAHVASLYAVADNVQWQGQAGAGKHCAINHADTRQDANRWKAWLGTDGFCAREVVPLESFDLGVRRLLETMGTHVPPLRARTIVVVAGTVREEGGQAEAIAAAAELARTGAGGDWALEICGDTELDSVYAQRCRERIDTAGLGQRIRINGCSDDVLGSMAAADIVLSPQQWGSFPFAIKEAMAVGALVVSTPVGGVPEIIIDGVSGILCADASPRGIAEGLERALTLPVRESRTMVEQARRVARSEFHPQRGASDRFEMYNRAIDLLRGATAVAAEAPVREEDVPATQEHAERLEDPGPPPTSHQQLHRHLTYRVVPQGRNWQGVDVLLGTHQRSASGRLALEVRSEAGRVVRTVTVDLATARDNEWVRFAFAPIANAANRPFLLRFSLTDPGPDTILSLYVTAPPEQEFRRRVRRRLGLPVSAALYCRTRYAS
ncbi:MAG TPA: glycosyltransferase [Candidatus Methylomirabilis sp.]|nr:glycosyltransferase [Candidatus Methylomirabilis sp.]